MPSVLQDWVQELPLMMQGTMMTGIRGNDLAHAPKMKPVIRWMRMNILNNGNPENDFMEVPNLPTVEEFEDELEYMSVHYFRHFFLTLEIIGYKHPDYEVSEIAMDYYLRLVNWCHLAPESHEELDERLSGKPGTTGNSKAWQPPGLVTSKKRLPTATLSPKTVFCAACNHWTDAANPNCSVCGADWKQAAQNAVSAQYVSCVHCGTLTHNSKPTCVSCGLDPKNPLSNPIHTRQGGGGYT